MTPSRRNISQRPRHSDSVEHLGQAAARSRTQRPVLTRIAFRWARWTGSGELAAIVATFTLGWVAVGIMTDFPRWWELAITIGVPLVSLEMLVVVQHSQSHATQATQLKLDELLRATELAANDLVAVEDASPSDLDQMHNGYAEMHRPVSDLDDSDRS